MKIKIAMRIIGVAIALVIFSLILFSFTKTNTIEPCLYSQIDWITWEELPEKMDLAPRKVVIDVYTQWCGWCKKMDATTFNQEHIAGYVNKHYYAIKFDAEYKQDIVFKDKTYKYVKGGRRGYHQLAAEITNGRLSFPTLVFLDENRDVIQSIPGYKDPLVFEQIITYFAQDMHKKKPWSAYCKSYKPMSKMENVKH